MNRVSIGLVLLLSAGATLHTLPGWQLEGAFIAVEALLLLILFREEGVV